MKKYERAAIKEILDRIRPALREDEADHGDEAGGPAYHVLAWVNTELSEVLLRDDRRREKKKLADALGEVSA